MCRVSGPRSPEASDLSTHHVGVVGGGQLARMAGEAASALGLSMAVLAERPDDAACGVAAEVVLGSPLVEADLRALAARCDVITFDHEQVDLALVRALEADGVVRPARAWPPWRWRWTRRTCAGSWSRPASPCRPTPWWSWRTPAPSGRGRRGDRGVRRRRTGGPSCSRRPGVATTARASGRSDDRGEVAGVRRPPHGAVLVEEMVPLEAELAVMVARRPSGESVAWPAVETAQVGGVCREVLVPGAAAGRGHAPRPPPWGSGWPRSSGAVGVLAVELFWSDGRLLVNEIAARPHNSGHWTMEGAVTSQFENHLRAVLDLPLGATGPQHAQVASVNVFGGAAGEDPVDLLPRGLAVAGAHVHLYGKEGRPGRKLGHVTVCGDDADDVRSRAWAAALALGTPRPEGLEPARGVAS